MRVAQFQTVSNIPVFRWNTFPHSLVEGKLLFKSNRSPLAEASLAPCWLSPAATWWILMDGRYSPTTGTAQASHEADRQTDINVSHSASPSVTLLPLPHTLFLFYSLRNRPGSHPTAGHREARACVRTVTLGQMTLTKSKFHLTQW